MELSNAPGVRRLMSNEDIRDLLEAARAETREMCADICKAVHEHYLDSQIVGHKDGYHWKMGHKQACEECAAAIRARGKTGEGT